VADARVQRGLAKSSPTSSIIGSDDWLSQAKLGSDAFLYWLRSEIDYHLSSQEICG